ncbi:MAG: hypothetical protein IKC22_04475 [Bacilli bacterium]|nr:hypothetical protein [Bacilli bacterium]
MNYRTLFLEFLSYYREYHFDSFQLLLFENNQQDNILKVINDKESIDLYQVKNAQTFYKKISFSQLNDTVANLLFITDKPQVLEISKPDNDLKKYLDLYNGKPIYDLNCKYLVIYPIYKEQQLLGGFFVYSNYQIIWQFNENKVFNFLDNLENAQSETIIDDISNKANYPFWIYTNIGNYLSNELAKSLNVPMYNTSFNISGKSLKQIDEFDYCNGKVRVYMPITKEKIKSIIEFQKLKPKSFTIIYCRCADNENLIELSIKINEIIEKIDGKLGAYDIYQTSNNSISIVYFEELTKKEVFDLFNSIPYILIRSHYEVKKQPDFNILCEYLNLSPIEEFNYDYYQYYIQSLLSEKKEQVLSNYTSSKIEMKPVVNAENMSLAGYIIKDLYDLTNALRENKLKSIKAISKLVDEYPNAKVIIDLKVKDILHEDRVHIAYLNVLKKLSSSCYFLIDFDKEAFYKITQLWDSFKEFCIIKEEDNNFLEILTIANEVKGVCLGSDYYQMLVKDADPAAFEITDFCVKHFAKVLVKVAQNDIIKYNNKNIMMICI